MMTVLQSLRRWWPIAAVAVLLAAAALAAAHSTPQLDRLPGAERSPAEQQPAETQPRTEPSGFAEQPVADGIELPTWLPGLVNAVCLLLVAGIALLLVWVLVRGLFRPETGAGSEGATATAGRPTDEEVIAVLDAGLSDLSDDDRDPRRAVIACWLRLEEAAAAAGMPRHVGDTPTDLVVRLLGAGGTSPRVLAGFADVYRAARYGTHEVDESMRRQARAALQRVRADLTGAGTARD